jgi:hypothetical protein
MEAACRLHYGCSSPHEESTMNKTTDTQTTTTQAPEAEEAIQATELENVTGGCTNCGCGQPNVAGGNWFSQFASRFRR